MTQGCRLSPNSIIIQSQNSSILCRYLRNNFFIIPAYKCSSALRVVLISLFMFVISFNQDSVILLLKLGYLVCFYQSFVVLYTVVLPLSRLSCLRCFCCVLLAYIYSCTRYIHIYIQRHHIKIRYRSLHLIRNGLYRCHSLF